MPYFLFPFLLCALAAPLFAGEPPTRIALFGGSSSATTYLPEEFKHHNLLRNALEAGYPGEKVEVYNFADNGLFIARYLLDGLYGKDYAAMQGKNIDIAILRCGINDAKRFSPKEFAGQTRQFIKLLQNDFPGVRIILETGFYLDYPKHYQSDRNRKLNPYWEVNRQIAKEMDLPLCDLYAESEKATTEGNWDLRIRSKNREKYPKSPELFYWGTELDAEYGHHPEWFTDVHPSPNGVRLAVDTEAALLRRLYPEKLPTGHGKTGGPVDRDQAFFVRWIDCPPERLELLKTKNPDQLQDATRK